MDTPRGTRGERERESESRAACCKKLSCIKRFNSITEKEIPAILDAL